MLRKAAESLLVLVLGSMITLAAEVNTPSTITLAIEPAGTHSSHADDPNGFTLAFLDSLETDVRRFSCPWARCLRAAQNGDVDILSHLYRTEEREAFLTFIYPPYSTQKAEFRFWTRKDFDARVKSADDLTNLKLAVIRGYVYGHGLHLEKIVDRIDVLTTQQMVEMVLRKRADAFIAPPSLTDQEIKRLDKQGLLEQQLFVFVEEKGVFLAVPKSSPWNSHSQYLSEKLSQFLTDNPTRKIAH